MLAIQAYNLQVIYKPGKELYIADSLSRSYISDGVDANLESLNEEVIGQPNW
jgi:hypothetical protein